MIRAKSICAAFLILACAPVLSARGGGGVEYLLNVGTDVVGTIPLGNGEVLDLPTGSLAAFSGFGYGVTRGGWKIGGFGIGCFGLNLSIPIPTTGDTITDIAGGFGGLISGGAGRLGAFAYSLNLRLGAGGLGVSVRWVDTDLTAYSYVDGVFAMYGAIDLELGLVIVPAMMVSVFAGLDVVAPLYPFVPAVFPTPVMGARITWGSF